jgi:hypothetical protein
VLTLQRDLRDAASVLDDPRVRAHLDLSRPVGLLFVAVLHFVPVEEAPAVLASYARAVAPGSCVAISAACTDAGRDPLAERAAQAMYRDSDVRLYFRTPSQVADLFAGFAPTQPVGDITAWHAGARTAPAPSGLSGGLGVKP